MPIDPATLTLITSLPIGIAIVIVLEGPWIYALLTGRLRTNKAWLEREGLHSAALLRVQAEADRQIAKAEEDTATWKDAWAAEQQRGDTATTSLGQAAAEMGQVATKLLHEFAPNAPTMGVIESAPVKDGI